MDIVVVATFQVLFPSFFCPKSRTSMSASRNVSVDLVVGGSTARRAY